MRLLFVKLKHIGDSLLLTPTLAAVRANYPEAEIWVVVRRGCEGILRGCPAIDRLLTAAAPESAKRTWWNWWEDLLTVRQARRQRFDVAFELSDGDRGRWIAVLSGATVRCASGAGRPLNPWWRQRFNRVSDFPWMGRHRVEKDFFTVNDALPLKGEPPPLVFSRERTEPWPAAAGIGNYAVIHPGTRWRRKRWPKEKWIELGRELLGRFPELVISAGPDSEELALSAELRAMLGPKVLCTAGQASWSQLAGLLYGARLFVGVDTAAMHLAAACQCPSVAIFGPSNPAEWRPWKVPHRIVTIRGPVSAGSVGTGGESLPDAKTGEIKVGDVIHACEDLLGRSSIASASV